MSDEFETAGLASLGEVVNSPPIQEAQEADARNICANCGAAVSGRHCEACGQLTADFHRPIWMLVKDVLSDAFSLDGRIARTIPALVFRPGGVTRAYLEGQRAKFVPPFRLFLLASLLFFFALFSAGDRLGLGEGLYFMPLPDGGYSINFGESGVLGEANGDSEESITPEQLRDLLEAEIIDEGGEPVDSEFIDNAVKAYENQQLIFMGIERWAPRLSILMLPLMTLFLTVFYLWYRRIYIYDHVIFSLHFQSFAYLLGAANLFIGQFAGGGIAWSLLFIPIYLYRQLRITYQSGRITSIIRVFGLLALLIFCLAAVSVGASFLGFRDVS